MDLDMNEAPERIWMDPTSEDEYGLFVCESDKRHGNLDVEYIRADIVEALKANLAKAVEALSEAVYLLDPDDEDIAKGAGLYRIVTTLKELDKTDE